MTDLERLIRDRQDALRGRREDWIDRLCDWRQHIDWFVLAVTALLGGGGLILILLQFA